jgi:hypothetical protein
LTNIITIGLIIATNMNEQLSPYYLLPYCYRGTNFPTEIEDWPLQVLRIDRHMLMTP